MYIHNWTSCNHGNKIVYAMVYLEDNEKFCIREKRYVTFSIIIYLIMFCCFWWILRRGDGRGARRGAGRGQEEHEEDYHTKGMCRFWMEKTTTENGNLEEPFGTKSFEADWKNETQNFFWWNSEDDSEDDSKGDPEENCLRTTLTRNEKISMKENYIVNCNYRQTWFKNCNWHCFQCISFISCFQIIFSLTFYLFSDKEEEEEGGKVRRQWKRLASE